jgi:hypothetical protein
MAKRGRKIKRATLPPPPKAKAPEYHDDEEPEVTKVFPEPEVPNYQQSWCAAESARLATIEKRIEAQRAARLMANIPPAKTPWKPVDLIPRSPLHFVGRRKKRP